MTVAPAALPTPAKTRPRRPRRDVAALAAAEEITETVAARMLHVSVSTLAKWRKSGFLALPVVPATRRCHGRLVAYSAADMRRVVDAVRPVPGWARSRPRDGAPAMGLFATSAAAEPAYA